MLVSGRVRRARVRAGRGRMRHRGARVPRPVVPLRQHGGMVLLRVQPRLPERDHVSHDHGRCDRQRLERTGTDLVARVGYHVPR